MSGKNWKSKMFVAIQTDEGQQLLTPILDINPVFNTPNTPEHSLEADNVGVTRGNDTFNFSLTVKALRDEDADTNPSEVLTKLALTHKKFNIVLTERETQASGGVRNWAFDSIMLEECYCNNANPTRAIVNGSPAAVFNCMCLRVNVDGVMYNGTLV